MSPVSNIGGNIRLFEDQETQTVAMFNMIFPKSPLARNFWEEVTIGPIVGPETFRKVTVGSAEFIHNFGEKVPEITLTEEEKW